MEPQRRVPLAPSYIVSTDFCPPQSSILFEVSFVLNEILGRWSVRKGYRYSYCDAVMGYFENRVNILFETRSEISRTLIKSERRGAKSNLWVVLTLASGKICFINGISAIYIIRLYIIFFFSSSYCVRILAILDRGHARTAGDAEVPNGEWN